MLTEPSSYTENKNSPPKIKNSSHNDPSFLPPHIPTTEYPHTHRLTLYLPCEHDIRQLMC